MYSKSIKLVLLIAIILILPQSVYAAPQLSINPSGGYIKEGEEFIIDILLDSDDEELVKAKAVITFDPTLAKIVKAERNNALFEQYPSDEQSTDNDNGVIMLTGFTQSGSDYGLYKTSGSADVFARVTFESLYDGALTFDWEYSGSDAPFKTVLLADGSPPQNALTGKPSSVSFTIQDTTGDGGLGNDGNPSTPIYTPNTGLTDDKPLLWGMVGIFGGILVFAGTSVLTMLNRKLRRSNLRTLVELD